MNVFERIDGYFFGIDKKWLKELVLEEDQRSRIRSLLQRMMIFCFLLGLASGINIVFFVQSVIA